MLGHRQLSRSQLGARQNRMHSLGNRMNPFSSGRSNFQTPNHSAGLHNVSNSEAVSRMPILGPGFKQPSARPANVEKARPHDIRNGKFA